MILKFKRSNSTYIIYTSSNNLSIDHLKDQLLQSIKLTGGLKLNDNEPVIEDEDDIPVPKSELMEDEPQEELQVAHDAITNVTPDDFKLAIPKDKTALFDNNWIELVDDSSVAKLVFNDYDVIVFAYQDEDFYVTEAVYDE